MQFPHSVTLDSHLTVDVYLHKFYLGDRDRFCWSYLTRGLENHGQREMALSLLADDGAATDDIPKTPFKMFQLLGERTSGDRHVDCGDSTRLGQRGIFGFPCLYYVPAIQFDTLPNLDNYLGLVLVHQEEYEYIRQYGLTRFLSRLGKFCSSFPYPTWNTKARPNLFPANTRELSMLADASHVSLDHSHVHLQGDTLQLQLRRQDADKALNALNNLDDDQVAILNTAFSPRCDASLYWQEGQQQPGAYAVPNSIANMIGGSFISLCHSNRSEMTISEDGFSVNLTSEQWQTFKRAIANRRSCKSELDDHRCFVLDFVDIAASPHARHYQPVAIWRQIETDAAAVDNLREKMENNDELETETKETKRIVMGEFTNLTGKNSLAERVNREDLHTYFHRILEALEAALSEEEDSFDFELELAIYPHQVLTKIVAGFELNPEFVAYILALMSQIETCHVTSQIRVRVPFSVNKT